MGVGGLRSRKKTARSGGANIGAEHDCEPGVRSTKRIVALEQVKDGLLLH